MSIRLRLSRFAIAVLTTLVALGSTLTAEQTPAAPAPTPQTTAGDEHAGHNTQDVTSHAHAGHEPQSASRDGSGTGWLPDDSPMYALHRESGVWQFMGHGNLFFQYLHDSGPRGGEQAGSINWLMGMAERGIGRGRLKLRGMVSIEPWTIRACGYPDLLATGEVCGGEVIHDRQHPHDLFMELAAIYERPLANGISLQVYGGPAGEPALGPVAFVHRLSAMSNPLAPITHHWFDSTHVTYGVVTAGTYGNRWKLEGSVFNGREPDETRTNIDLAGMDSWSGRVWLLPSRRWALQLSAGHLNEAEEGEQGSPPADVDRLTASALYHRLLPEGGVWASTIGWGRNSEPGADATHALLLESNVTFNDRDAWFGRFEFTEKSSHDLAVPGNDVVTVAKLQGGYSRYLGPRLGVKPGVGASVSVGIVPSALRPAYGSRVNGGFGIYLTLRPASHGM